MRVLFVYYTHKPGGLCTRLYRLMNAHAASAEVAEYLCLDEPPARLDSRVRWTRIPFWTKRRSGLLFWACFTLWLPCFLLWRVWRSKPERVVAFGAYYAASATVATRACRVPLVLFLRSLTFEIDRITGKPGWLRRITGVVDRLGIKSADCVVCMSRAMKSEVETFIGRELPRVSILPNDIPERGAAARPFEMPEVARLAKARGAKLLLVAGVLDRRKNVMVLMEAIEILKRRHLSSELHLLIAGMGPELERLQAYAEAMELSNVSFLGWVTELPAVLAQVDLLVHPALHEGVPNVVLEAAALGCSVMVSDIPEHAEIIHDPSARVHPAHSLLWADALGRFVTEGAFQSQLRAVSSELAVQLSFPWEERALSIVEKAGRGGL